MSSLQSSIVSLHLWKGILAIYIMSVIVFIHGRAVNKRWVRLLAAVPPTVLGVYAHSVWDGCMDWRGAGVANPTAMSQEQDSELDVRYPMGGVHIITQ